MSDEDRSGDSRNFLARWAQRKQEAKQPDRRAPPAEADTAPGPAAESVAEEPFDLSSLPKLEDLTETSDITAFLRKGVPESLRNAALRKSWALDPAIRNYVNPALEYAYDWNTPGGVPGNSEIGAGVDVARLVSQVMGSSEQRPEPSLSSTDPGKEPSSDSAASPDRDAALKAKPDLPVRSLRLPDEAACARQDRSSVAGGDTEAGQARNSKPNDSVAPQQAMRRHGTAKPVV